MVNKKIISKEDQQKDISKHGGDVKSFKDFHIIMADYHSGDPNLQMKAKEDAVQNLKQFVAYILTRNYSTYCAKDFDDLMQQGYLGILTGLESYDPDKSMPTTYFKTFIKCEVSKYITEFKNHSTAHYASILNKISKAAKYFEAHGIEYDDVKLAEFCSLSLVSVREALASKEKAISVNFQDELANETTSDSPIIGHLAVNDNPESEYMKKEQAEQIARALNECLTENERFVIMNRYGFTDKSMTHPQIAKALGITVNESKAMQQRALNKLRKSFLGKTYNDTYNHKTWLSEAIEFFPEPEETDTEIVFTELDDIDTANSETA